MSSRHLASAIGNLDFDFEHRVVIVNRVRNRSHVESLARDLVKKRVIDEVVFAEDYSQEIIESFAIDLKLMGNFDYSRCQLVGIRNAETDYIVHFTGDSMPVRCENFDWITSGVSKIEADSRFITVTASWTATDEDLRMGAVYIDDDWMGEYGFSDNCYLIPVRQFRSQIYSETNIASRRFPPHAGFEKQVDAYMRNNDLLRIVSRRARYIHGTSKKRGIANRKEQIKRFVSLFEDQVTSKFKSRTTNVLPLQTPKQFHDLIEITEAPQRVDAFYFFNEFDILRLRLGILWDSVDEFVLMESPVTFSGKKKPLYFSENAARFSSWNDKIRVHVTEDSLNAFEELHARLADSTISQIDRAILSACATTSSVPRGETHWLREFFQKEAVKRALARYSNDTHVYISDVDEIWNPRAHRELPDDDIVVFKQLAYAYYLDNRSNEPWIGTIAAKWKNLRHEVINHLRTQNLDRRPIVEDGGWHFTNMGGVSQISAKLGAYGHQEFNTPDVLNKLEHRLERNEDFLGRRFKFTHDSSDLPEYLLNNRHLFGNLLREID